MRPREERSARLLAAALAGSLLAVVPGSSLRRAHAEAPAVPPASGEAPAEGRGTAARQGLLVLAPATSGAARDAAWSLARALYANDALRPPHLDEAAARALIGEPLPAGRGSEHARNLAAMRDAVHGDDVASRALLAAIARATSAVGVVVVFAPDPSPRASQGEMDLEARVYLASSDAFDAARYGADPRPPSSSSAPPSWSGATASLARTFGAPVGAGPGASNPPPAAAVLSPLFATPPKGPADAPGDHHAFYESPWFWAAVGAAALAGTATYFLTRDNDPSTIHLQLQVPK